MAKNFDIIYPPKERIKFSGGLNAKYDKQHIADNESPSCLNVVFGGDSVETRGGSQQLNTAAVGTFAGDGLFTRHDSSGAQTMCAWWNGTLYTLGATTFTTVPSGQSVFTAGTRVGASEYENNIFFGNGSTIPYRYDGAQFVRHGIYPPQSAPAATSANTGALTGDYQYKVTYVNSGLVESDVSSACATITVASATIGVSIPTAPASFGVGYRYLYRTVAGGSAFKRVTTISDNTTTTFSDNIADSGLGATAPTDMGVPPGYSQIVYHKDRLFMNDPTEKNLVWYTELTNPYTVKATNFIRAGDSSGEVVEGLAVYNDALVIFCTNSLHINYMEDSTPTNWQQIKTRSPFGSKSPGGAFFYNNKLMFPATQSNKLVGFAALSGAAIEQDATLLTIAALGSETKSARIEPDVFNFHSTYIKNIVAFVYKNKAYISVPYGATATGNNRIYVFDFSREDLTKRQEGAWIPWTGINAAAFTEYNGNLYAQDAAATGAVHLLNSSTYSDNGTAINSYYWTKEFSGVPGHEAWTKDFRGLSLMYEKSGDYYMDFGYRVNSDKGDASLKQINLNPGGSLWGLLRWGLDVWGGGSTEGEENLSFGQIRGERIQFKFTNQNKVGQKFKVLGLQFFYNLKGKR